MIVYPEGKIEYDNAGPHLVMAAQRFHPVPVDYHAELYRRLKGIGAMKAQTDGAPSDRPDAEGFSPDCVENTVKMVMENRRFEPMAMTSPRQVSLAGLLKGFGMPAHLLEVYLAMRPFQERGYPLTEGIRNRGIELLMVDRVLKEEKKGGFHYIDPERGVHNYKRAISDLDGGRGTMMRFYEACRDYVNAVWQYGIIQPDVAVFADNAEESGQRVGVLVEPAHAGAVARVLEGKKLGKPDKWEKHLAEEPEKAPVPPISLHHVEAVQAVSRLAEPSPKIGVATKLGRKISRGFTSWINR